MTHGADAADIISAYTNDLWRGQQGWACLGLGGGPHRLDGRYQHETFEHRFFKWPDRAQTLIRVAMQASPDHDVWVCPMLRSRPKRLTGTGIGGRHLWADIDRPLVGDARALVDRLRGDGGGFSVASGTTGHQHLYVRLRDEAPAEIIVALNWRLAATLGADAKWDETSLLRLPGTLNHKARVNGGDATLVQILTARQ